jgi:hypothetical protein
MLQRVVNYEYLDGKSCVPSLRRLTSTHTGMNPLIPWHPGDA